MSVPTKTTTWIIEPHEPLIFRDGRPFGLNPGTRIASLPFPFPSTMAGCVRTRAGQDEHGLFQLKDEMLTQLKTLQVRGPLLIQLPTKTDAELTPAWLAPVPGDLLFLKVLPKDQQESAKTVLKRLVPLQLAVGDLTDLPDLAPETLLPVGMTPYTAGKPTPSPVQYWTWRNFQAWLRDPDQLLKTLDKPDLLEHYEPQREQRVHISIDAARHTAIEGLLFETGGIEFTAPGKHEQRLSATKRLALAVEVEQESFQLREGQGTFGSERRVVSWRRTDTKFPACPEEVVQAITRDKACRLILLTPAYFQRGCLPEYLVRTGQDVQVQVQALVTERPQVVSGWDMERHEAKQTHRLVPAGAVFFLKLQGSDRAMQQWIQETWMQCVSDEPQWRCDGFGLAALGTWNGKPQVLKVGE